MNINWNPGDFSLDSIRKDSKLFNLLTRNTYKVYGLTKVKSNNPIDISYYASTVSLPDLKILVKLFQNNGIKISIASNDIDAKDCVYIGLRRDVRDDIVLAGTLLQIIIYYFENRLVIDSSYKMPTIPYFYEAIEEKENKEEKEELKF
jgi:hypothetical protein